MRIALAALLVGIVVSGCSLGSHGAATTNSDGGLPAPATSVILARPVGHPMGTRSQALTQCPRAAQTCRTVKLGRATYWATVNRRLNCSPASGEYTDSDAACRALTTLIHGLRTHRAHLCMCALEIGPGFSIVGRYRSKDVRLHFTGCTLCGAPKGTSAAFSTLFV
jgi:hypothetical protein